MTKGYLIANLEVTDAAGFERYRAEVPAVIERFGGRYLVRGGALEAKEDAGRFKRVVVLEFETIERARQFYESDAYAPLLALRAASTRSEVVLVEGA